MNAIRDLLVTGVACAGLAAPAFGQAGAGASVSVADAATVSVSTSSDATSADNATSPPAQSAAPGAPPADNAASVGELIGDTVATASGDTIGQIDDVVTIRGEIMAIVGVGGFLGFGEHDVALPVTELTLQQDSVAAKGYTRDQVKSMRAYRPEAAEPLRTDTMVTFGNS